jgi:O-antigen ligase
MLQRFFIPAVIGFAPLILFLLNWDAEGMSPVARLLREFTVTVIAAELFTIAVALREGMLAAWKSLVPPRPAAIALAALLAIAIATAAFIAPAPDAAAIRTGYWIMHLLFGFAVAFLCGRSFRSSDLVGAYLTGFVAFAVAFVIFAVGAMQRPIDWTWDLPSFSHIRHLGIYATPMIGFSIGIMATTRRRLIWRGAFLIAACGFALALWTGSRGPVAAIAGAVIVGLLVSPAMRRPQAWGGAALSLAIAYFVVALLPVPADNMGALRTIAATTESGDLLTGRMTLWRLVLDAIQHRPLLGYGEGQMRDVAHFGRMAQPHNIVLQLLLAWGIAGLLCALVLAFYFVRLAVPAVLADPARVLPPLLAMTSLLGLSMLDAALYHILPLSIFAACAGMIAAGRRDQPAPGYREGKAWR